MRFCCRASGGLLCARTALRQCAHVRYANATRIACKPQGLLQPLPIPTERFARVSMDFITNLPACHGYNACFTVVDFMTKRTRLIPCTMGDGLLAGEEVARISSRIGCVCLTFCMRLFMIAMHALLGRSGGSYGICWGPGPCLVVATTPRPMGRQRGCTALWSSVSAAFWRNRGLIRSAGVMCCCMWRWQLTPMLPRVQGSRQVS